MNKFDLCVIGAGPAGYHASIRASQLGGKVALVEKLEVGGLCLNNGCIPTKALLQSAKILNKMRKAGEHGIDVKDFKVDFSQMRSRAKKIVSRLKTGLRDVLSSYDIQIIKGIGRPISKGCVEVYGRNGSRKVIECENLVIATGSRPVKPWEVEGLIPDEEAWRLEEPPESLIILKGNTVGVELAYLFNSLGSETTIVERHHHILPGFDGEVAATLHRALKEVGIDILTSAETLKVGSDENGVAFFLSNGEVLKAVKAIATERIGNIDDLGLPELGVKTKDHFIVVNDKMGTSVDGIYAAGDVAGGSSAHEAFLQGTIVGENLFGIDSSMVGKPIPRCVYTSPEAACIGMTEEEARRSRLDVKVGRFPFSANGRALCLGEGEGFVKLVVDAKYGEVLGVHMIGPMVTELVGSASLAMVLEATPETMAEAVYPHPSLIEALKEAALSYHGRSIHLPKSRRRF